MNDTNFVEFSCYFLFYSFVGWLLISLFVSGKNRQWQNRGLMYGPWQPAVGAAAVAIQIALERVPHNLFLVFLIGMLFGGVVDFLARLIEEKYLNIQPSKYAFRSSFFNGKFDGLFTVGYGFLTVLMSRFFDPFFHMLMAQVEPQHLRTIATWLLGLFVLDFLLSLGVIIQLFERLKAGAASEYQHEFSDDSSFRRTLKQVREGQWLALKLRNLRHSYLGFTVVTEDGSVALPEMRKRQTREKEVRGKSFASGLNFYKLFWVFLIACVLGYIIESVWCVIRHGRLESRQGLIYGPFSQVYGIGAVAMVLILSRLQKKGRQWVFIGSALLGGIVEVVLSYVQEAVFGSVSWNYQQATLGIAGGRTNLIYMLFWGVLGLWFIERVYPKLSDLIEAIPNARGIFLTWVIGLFLVFDIGVSGIAVYRWSERTQDIPPASAFWQAVDQRYPDDYMKEIYPNMVMRKGSG